MKRKLKEILIDAQSYESDELSYQEIKWLIEATLKIEPYQLLSLKEAEFEDSLLMERLNKAKTIPAAYILNSSTFYGREFYVDKNVLIPRNETEELLELTLRYIYENKMNNFSICDVGTGSGCIAISLKCELDNKNIFSEITAVDISKEALEIARKNSNKFNKTIHFIESDCLFNTKNNFEIIISNPPYIDKNLFVQERVLRNEPHLSLFAENKGLDIYEKILSTCQNNASLKAVFFEMSPEQENALKELGELYLPEFVFSAYKDMNGFIRFVSFIKK